MNTALQHNEKVHYLLIVVVMSLSFHFFESPDSLQLNFFFERTTIRERRKISRICS